jgi:hypothetical protein
MQFCLKLDVVPSLCHHPPKSELAAFNTWYDRTLPQAPTRAWQQSFEYWNPSCCRLTHPFHHRNMYNHHDNPDTEQTRPGKSGILHERFGPSGTRVVNTTTEDPSRGGSHSLEKMIGNITGLRDAMGWNSTRLADLYLRLSATVHRSVWAAG